MKTFDKVYHLVTLVPKGKVTTYGAIAKLTGLNPRVVGYALHANKDPENVPCHRVINSKGELSGGYAFGGPDIQRQILEEEEIKFDKNSKVDLKIFGHYI